MMQVLQDLELAYLQHAGHEQESKGSFKFGNHIITFSLSKCNSYIEVYNPIKDIYLVNVEQFLLSIEREIQDDEYDEYDDHGFDDSEDYNKYKL